MFVLSFWFSYVDFGLCLCCTLDYVCVALWTVLLNFKICMDYVLLNFEICMDYVLLNFEICSCVDYVSLNCEICSCVAL